MEGTISSKNLANIKTVLYHGSCPDGIISREILKKVFGTSVRYVPYYFDEFKEGEIPSFSLFVDCSPKSHQVEQCLRQGCLIAEHHDSFIDSFHKFDEIYQWSMIFGKNEYQESGVTLALTIAGIVDPTWHDERVHDLEHLISMSDTWKKDDPQFDLARMYAGYISFFSNDFCEDICTLTEKEATIRAFGKVQERVQRNYAKGAILFDVDHLKVAMINGLNMSNAAEMLRSEKNIDLICGFQVQYDDRQQKNITIYSMRSKEDGFDVSAFAKANNGGGHKAAAGFTVAYEMGNDPIDLFRRMVDSYLFHLDYPGVEG